MYLEHAMWQSTFSIALVIFSVLIFPNKNDAALPWRSSLFLWLLLEYFRWVIFSIHSFILSNSRVFVFLRRCGDVICGGRSKAGWSEYLWVFLVSSTCADQECQSAGMSLVGGRSRAGCCRGQTQSSSHWPLGQARWSRKYFSRKASSNFIHWILWLRTRN